MTEKTRSLITDLGDVGLQIILIRLYYKSQSEK